MKTSKLILTTLAALLFCATALSKSTTSEQHPSSEPSILYSQMSESATIAKSNQPGWYELTLHNINGNTLWFTDRPIRKSGTLTNKEFVNEWKTQGFDDFVHDNPNASLVAFFDKNKIKKEVVIVMRLSKPSYEAKTRTMHYQVQFISKNQQEFLAAAPVYEAALFIDSLGSVLGSSAL